MIFLLFSLSSAAAAVSNTPDTRVLIIAESSRIYPIDKDDRVYLIKFNDRIYPIG